METERKTLAVRRSVTWAITLAKLSGIVLLIILANIGISWLIDRLEIQIWPEHMEIVDRAVLIGVILYIGLMATPFLPGIEIGLAFMIVLGSKGILLIYICTLVALTISFGLGRLFPTHLLVSLLRWLNLARAAALLKSFDATPPEKRLEFLAGKAPTQTIPVLLKRRYLILALLLNLPGNALLGGGGGIAMMAGISRLYSFPKYFLLIAIAILPGPILVMLSNFFQ
ncbi:MAG: hypothetical protein OES46_15080 [Gammaproteobacteria bacterium]|jgi:hypothetical protein|nr:hypothetical protein [Gammaproteobacteria bacterium]